MKMIPEGTKDFIFEEAESLKKLENKLYELYTKLGFRPVQTPTLEYYETFDGEKRFIEQEQMYKLTDSDGRLIVLRPDNTSPIARLVASRLRNEELPLRLCYNQRVYRVSPNFNAKQNELLQSGIELIGGEEEEGDICAMFTALNALEQCGSDYKLEIGHSSFIDALISDFALSKSEKKSVKDYISSKNSAGYDFSVDEKVLAAVKQIPRLCGGGEVIESAYKLARGNKRAEDALEYVKKLYGYFVQAGYGDKIIIDLGIVQKIDYYTGIVFRGYISGIGEVLLSGGRYDALYNGFGYPNPACGFAVNVSCVSALNLSEGMSPKNVPFDNGVQSIIAAKELLK